MESSKVVGKRGVRGENKKKDKETTCSAKKQTKTKKEHLPLVRVDCSEVAGRGGVGEENIFVHCVHMLDQSAKES